MKKTWCIVIVFSVLLLISCQNAVDNDFLPTLSRKSPKITRQFRQRRTYSTLFMKKDITAAKRDRYWLPKVF